MTAYQWDLTNVFGVSHLRLPDLLNHVLTFLGRSDGGYLGMNDDKPN